MQTTNQSINTIAFKIIDRNLSLHEARSNHMCMPKAQQKIVAYDYNSLMGGVLQSYHKLSVSSKETPSSVVSFNTHQFCWSIDSDKTTLEHDPW